MNNKQTYNCPIVKIILFMLLISAYSFAEPDFHLLMTIRGESPGDYFSTVVGLGDFNQDGYDDFAVGGYKGNYVNIYYGSSSPDTNAILKLTGEEYFGWALASGDFNGDGVPDLIVGACNANVAIGQVSIYFGGEGFTGIPDIVIDGPRYNGFFGWDVANAGDINGDGYEDFIISSNTQWESCGYVYIYFGSSELNGEWDYCFQGQTEDHIGFSIDGIGDINHDGYDDIIVGTSSEEADIIYGGKTLNDNNLEEIKGDTTICEFGFLVSGIGDINHDSIPDFVITSSTRYRPNNRLINIYSGDSLKLMYTFRGFDYNGGIYSISSKMDVNNDGINDLLVGFGDDNSIYKGKVLCYMGGSDFDTIPDFILEGTTEHSYFGRSIADLGDINGDGNKNIAITENNKVFIYTFGEYSEVKEKTVPAGYHLKQNYPNPFNPETTIRYSLPEASHVTLYIYDITGRMVEQIINQHTPAGYHTVTWDASSYSSGVYIARLKAGSFVKTQKMVLMK
ncbi:MAG: hypothetical protein DRP86_08445 [Candidatus Neomarinimicrobiota bacterium]|nr:MAG: hypothetical protein DRP86_08445 [Candidatus Neomarinimicrobiota bacterium]